MVLISTTGTVGILVQYPVADKKIEHATNCDNTYLSTTVLQEEEAEESAGYSEVGVLAATTYEYCTRSSL